MKKIVNSSFIFVLLFLVSSGLKTTSANSSFDATAVPYVDLERFSGEWYEISSFPNKLQEKCLGNTTVTFSITRKKKIKILNQCLKRDGKILKDKKKAKIADEESNSKWKVKFRSGFFSVLPFGGSNKFWVVDLDKDYKYTAIGTPNGEYLTILSKTPEIENKIYEAILERVKKMNFNPNKLIKTQHGLKKN